MDEVGGNVQVTVNGEIDAESPAASNVSLIDVYGSKNGDNITVGPEVTIPATLDGGHGDGVNYDHRRGRCDHRARLVRQEHPHRQPRQDRRRPHRQDRET